MLVKTDSPKAHAAVVEAICTRLQEDQRRTFDGPNEFQYKNRQVRSILREYQSTHNPELRALLKTDLLEILKEFTGTGQIAQSVLMEYRANMAGGNVYSSGDASTVQAIVLDIIQTGLTAPDADFMATATELFEHYLKDARSGITSSENPLQPSAANLIFTLVDAASTFKHDSLMPAVERLAQEVFRDDKSAISRVRLLADLNQSLSEYTNSPKYLLPLKAWRDSRPTYSKDPKTKEQVTADDAMALAREPRTVYANQIETVKNNLLIELIKKSAVELPLPRTPRQSTQIEGLIKRLEIHLQPDSSLPQVYNELLKLALSNQLTINEKSRIAWHFSDAFKYSREDASAASLLQIVIDIYQIGLGPTDHILFPEKKTEHLLSAATYLANEQRGTMFKAASEEQLNVFQLYSKKMNEFAAAVQDEYFLPETVLSNEDREAFLRNVTDVMREIQNLYKHFEKFLLIEAVKVDQTIYYPWVIRQMYDFVRGLNWEVGEGNRPDAAITKLYQTVMNFWDGLKTQIDFETSEVIDPDSFDLIKTAKFDELLQQLFLQMAEDHNIQYNNTVWQKGLPFLGLAIRYMPEQQMQHIVEKYKKTNSRFADHVQRTWDNSRKAPESGVVALN